MMPSSRSTAIARVLGLGVETTVLLAEEGRGEQLHRHRGDLRHLRAGVALEQQREPRASKEWKAWPASWSSVRTSPSTPTAFMKMSGICRNASVGSNRRGLALAVVEVEQPASAIRPK